MAIFDILTTAAKIAKESGKLELQGEILGVYEKLLEQQQKISDLEIENRELKDARDLKKNLVYRGEVYYLQKDSDKEDGPFCSLCHDTKKLLVRMTPWNETCKKCMNCKGVYSIL